MLKYIKIRQPFQQFIIPKIAQQMDNLELDKEFPMSHQDQTYYHEYVRLYLANIALTAQVKQLVEEKNMLASRLSKYEDEDGCSSYDKTLQKNKRFRRTAHQIERFYKCTVKSCEKSYGSEGSLNQHYKLKHPEIYVTLPNVQPTKGQFEDYQQSIQEKEVRPKRRQPLKQKQN